MSLELQKNCCVKKCLMFTNIDKGKKTRWMYAHWHRQTNHFKKNMALPEKLSNPCHI